MKQLFNNIVGKVASALAFKENQDACVRKPLILLDENIDPKRAHDISAQSHLLQKLVDAPNSARMQVAGHNLIEEFEKSLTLNTEDRFLENADQLNLEDIDHDTACEMVFNALETTSKSAEKFASLYKVRNAMHVTINEYITPRHLSREHTLGMLTNLITEHKIDDLKNSVLISKATDATRPHIKGNHYDL